MELYRIIVMLLIVAHHYVVNSGLTDVMANDLLNGRSIFLSLFGMWGKVGINCFVMITGYFMCTSTITTQKFLKLFLEVMIYKIVFYMIFLFSGYEAFTLHGLKALFPIASVKTGFVSCFLLFYLFIPFLNALINNLSRKAHLSLMLLCLTVYTVLASLKITVSFNYVTWFSVLYIIASYIRLYGLPGNISHRMWGKLTLTCVVCSMLSVVVLMVLADKAGKSSPSFYYFLVNDSNKLLAVFTSVSSFMFFKNLKIKQNRWINTIAASTFGVLLIHANSNTMRQWLWQTVMHNADMYYSDYLILHAIGGVLLIFALCIVIDRLRILYIEKPFFNYLVSRYNNRMQKIDNLILIEYSSCRKV